MKKLHLVVFAMFLFMLFSGCRAQLYLEEQIEPQKIPIENPQMTVLDAIGEDGGIVLDGRQEVQAGRYIVSPCIFTNNGMSQTEWFTIPIRYEVNYPQIYVLTEDEDSQLTYRQEINKLLFDAALSLIENLNYPGYGYVNYDISFASEDILSICFYGSEFQGGAGPNYLIYALTIDIASGTPQSLSKYLTIDDQLGQQISAGEYNLLHKNSFAFEGTAENYLQSIDWNTYFIENAPNEHNFFLSDESIDGLFLILKGGRYYFILGKR